MTINELNTSKWKEFVFDLVDAKKKQILEKPYQDRIGDCPKGYNMYEFRESDDSENYLASIEPHVSVNHSGTFVTRSKIPFGENANGYSLKVCYGHYY